MESLSPDAALAASAMPEDLEWEEWDSTSSDVTFGGHCLAGSFAGVAEHTLLYPLDTIKTCWQSQVLSKGGVGSGCGSCSINAIDGGKAAATTAGKRPAAMFPAPSGILSTVRNLVRHGHGSTAVAAERNIMSSAVASAAAASSGFAASAQGIADGAGTSTGTGRNNAGVMRLWRGVQTMFVGCIPAHALYFSSYEIIKSTCLELEAEERAKDYRTRHHAWREQRRRRETDSERINFDSNVEKIPPPTAPAHDGTLGPQGAMLAGGVATLLHDLVMTPMDTVKQRMQLGHYESMRHAFGTFFNSSGTSGLRGEGWTGLYRSLPITVATNVPYGMIMVTTNEFLRGAFERTLYGDQTEIDDGQHHPLHFATIVFSGCGSGAVASALTAPLDRIKTRLQTQRLGIVATLPSIPTSGQEKFVMEERAVDAARGKVATCPKVAARQVRDAFRGGGAASSSYSTSAHVSASACIPKVSLSYASSASSSAAKSAAQAPHYATPLAAFRSIVAEEGYRGLFRGTLPRVAMHAPSVAISWTAYEAAKGWLVTMS